MQLPNFEIERKHWDVGKSVIGIDEAGRGCLAGPVVAAAVILPKDFNQSVQDGKIKINDSKKLTSYERGVAYDFIVKNSIFCDYAILDNSLIDKYNILFATQIAMNLSISRINLKNTVLLIDGNYYQNLFSTEYHTIIKGDSKSLSIAAASIVAKVIRDQFVVEFLNSIFPNYGFNEHKGYATKQHLEAIKKYGKTPFHRNTFLKKYHIREETEKYQLKLF